MYGRIYSHVLKHSMFRRSRYSHLFDMAMQYCSLGCYDKHGKTYVCSAIAPFLYKEWVWSRPIASGDLPMDTMTFVPGSMREMSHDAMVGYVSQVATSGGYWTGRCYRRDDTLDLFVDYKGSDRIFHYELSMPGPGYEPRDWYLAVGKTYVGDLAKDVYYEDYKPEVFYRESFAAVPVASSMGAGAAMAVPLEVSTPGLQPMSLPVVVSGTMQASVAYEAMAVPVAASISDADTNARVRSILLRHLPDIAPPGQPINLEQTLASILIDAGYVVESRV